MYHIVTGLNSPDGDILYLHIQPIHGAPRGFGYLGRMAIYFQGAGEDW